ncbi:MAG: hypothetical protein AAF827_14600 [Cyanobacteria bacterium P01_D01_bin.6]
MNLYDLVKWFAQPIVRIAIAVLGPLGVILGTFANPEGAVNSFLVRLIDWIAPYMPSTPENLKLANLIFSGGAIPIGQAVLNDVFQLIGLMLGVVLIIKIYKLIPFKAT